MTNIENELKKTNKGSEILLKSFLWSAYFSLSFLYQSRDGVTRSSETCLNAFFAPKLENIKNLIYLFRPNFLAKPIKNIDTLPSFEQVDRAVLEKQDFNIEGHINKFLYEFHSSLRDLHQKEGEIKENLYRQVKGDLIAPSSALDQIDKEKEVEASNLRGIEILLKRSLAVNSIPQKIKLREKKLYYHPYYVFGIQKQQRMIFSFYDIGKSGGILGKIFKNEERDTALSKLCKIESKASSLLKHALGC